MNFEKIKSEFQALSASAQWKWIVENRAMISEIIVDNDNTSIFLGGDNEAYFMLLAKADCGNRSGVVYLLRALGFTANYC